MKKEDLLGTWKLESFDIKKTAWSSWGDNLRGLLIYDASGYMAASINRNVGSPVALDDCIFYSGKYELTGNQVVHHMENATDEGKIDSDLTREASLKGDQLTLTGKSLQGTEFRLVWKKIN